MNTFKRVLLFLTIGAITLSGVYANEPITRGQAFIYFAHHVGADIPDSYKYIDLYYTGIDESSKQGQALQKLIYLGLINNTTSDLELGEYIDFKTFEAFSTKILQLVIKEDVSDETKRSTLVTQDDLKAIETTLKNRSTEVQTLPVSTVNQKSLDGLPEKAEILVDVYETLTNSHYNKDNFTNDQIINGAIKGATDSVGDKYTTYFPPVESKSFTESLEGSFEGIGAYIEMPTPGELIIISPIVGSPAETAGLKGGDQIIAVDGVTVTENNSISEVISWIKGPKGSTVELTIKREGSENNLQIEVVRDTIVIKDVQHEKLSQNTYYIQIKSFGSNVTSEFKEALTAINEDTQIKKIIIDVRNNPGGFLNEVSAMLSYFVESGEATAIIDYGDRDLEYKSRGYDLIDTSKYELVLLQNSGSASASEILVGTLKDYFPESTIIGEQSFGKGSVQSLKTYYDGSTLKYTTAKWFTGKTKIGIDGVGITPDILLPLDEDELINNGVDNQLERAKRN